MDNENLKLIAESLQRIEALLRLHLHLADAGPSRESLLIQYANSTYPPFQDDAAQIRDDMKKVNYMKNFLNNPKE